MQRDKLSMLDSWPSAPMNVCTAMQSAFMRMESSMSTATTSCERSSLIMEEPEDTRSAMPFLHSGGTQVRSAPRVPISTSTLGSSLGMVISRRSSPAVEPMK